MASSNQPRRTSDASVAGHDMELTILFSIWASNQQTSITWQQISERWRVSRATAYRWLAAWKSATSRISSHG